MPVARCPCEDSDSCPFTPACPVEMSALGMTVSQANEGFQDATDEKSAQQDDDDTVPGLATTSPDGRKGLQAHPSRPDTDAGHRPHPALQGHS
jgi:hypothetical protein